MPALYLALETQTAIREYQQASSLLPPGTLVSYAVRLSRVADYSAGYSSRDWDPLWEDFVCDWRELWFNHHIEPPSWVVADQAVAAGAQGILFRSQVAPPGLNLVVYTETLTKDDELSVSGDQEPRLFGGEDAVLAFIDAASDGSVEVFQRV